jgi:transcriptional regulator of aromatic amino acid metabolism
MKSVLKIVQRIGPADANVLITGENGTGKEVIARSLHAVSNRAAKPLVTLNAGALAEGLFEVSCLGTCAALSLMPRRIASAVSNWRTEALVWRDRQRPLNLQAKLLRVLETGEFERWARQNQQGECASVIGDQRGSEKGRGRRKVPAGPVSTEHG